jgi:hypothetical protein
MTKNNTTEPAAAAGTIKADPDAARSARAARAQAELIEMLARLVLAAVEADAAGTRAHRPRDHARDRRARQPDA